MRCDCIRSCKMHICKMKIRYASMTVLGQKKSLLNILSKTTGPSVEQFEHLGKVKMYIPLLRSCPFSRKKNCKFELKLLSLKFLFIGFLWISLGEI
jgi:hypothetical protein